MARSYLEPNPVPLKVVHAVFSGALEDFVAVAQFQNEKAVAKSDVQVLRVAFVIGVEQQACLRVRLEAKANADSALSVRGPTLELGERGLRVEKTEAVRRSKEKYARDEDDEVPDCSALHFSAQANVSALRIETLKWARRTADSSGSTPTLECE